MKHGQKDNTGIWLDTLKDLTPKALESGMQRLKNLSSGSDFCEFPPNCLQFKALCTDFYNRLQLPKAQDAYKEIKNKAYSRSALWSHEIVKYIASRLPANFLTIEPELVAYGLFEKAYDQVCSLVKQGHAIPDNDVIAMLPKKQNHYLAREHLKLMRRQLGAVENK